MWTDWIGIVGFLDSSLVYLFSKKNISEEAYLCSQVFNLASYLHAEVLSVDI